MRVTDRRVVWAQAIADGTQYKVPATIDDPAILDEITSALQSIGYAKG